MAQITINEISQNYSFAIGQNSFATVAMPIMSCWGPGFFNGATYLALDEETKSDYAAAANTMLEQTVWRHYPATQAGLESYVADYRGPITNYRLAQDYSYYMGLTLMTAGYDLLVCRLCPGACAKADIIFHGKSYVHLGISAKYPGSFGNNLRVKLIKRSSKYEGETVYYWNAITYILDKNTKIQTAVENKTFYFNIANSYKFGDAVPHISEIDSNFLIFSYDQIEDDDMEISTEYEEGEDKLILKGGTDIAGEYDLKLDGEKPATALSIAASRFKYFDTYYSPDKVELNEDGTGLKAEVPGSMVYLQELAKVQDKASMKDILRTREWVFSSLVDVTLGNIEKGAEDIQDLVILGGVLDLLTDKLSYNPNRLVLPGWDDQDMKYLGSEDYISKKDLSPLHLKMMQTAYASRCATALLDLPRSLRRRDVHIEAEADEDKGYVQTLSAQQYNLGDLDNNSSLFTSNSAIFGPWAQFKYTGLNGMKTASPGFLALMIQRAQIKNQSIQYEWALPTNRKHNLSIGKIDYNVPKKLLDQWQKLDGVSVNVLTTIPDLGTNIWGNSTLFEVPPATYQALANLSTRYLFNAIEDVVFRIGISITFTYNNAAAYDRFYAGVTPILDTMQNVGAIDGYKVEMSADINGVDQVNANSIIGKIWLIVNGVVNDLSVDLVALPPGTDLGAYTM